MSLLTLIALALLSACASYPPSTPPDGALPPGVSMTTEGDLIVISGPTGTAARSPMASTGIIFYPGGLVDPEAYVSVLAPLAGEGHPVVIVRMPGDLAVLAPRRATRVLDTKTGGLAQAWVIGGHSLGGAMAARFVARDASDYPQLEGLVLLGAYPAGSDSLAKRDIPVLSIWASNDGLATAQNLEETRPLLPANATFAVIQGGNHSGFGEYGPQDGDGERTISLDEQHEQVQSLILEFLQSL